MERLDLYRCNVCGNIVEVFVAGGGELVCCGEPMSKLEAKHNEEALMEKHVPAFIKTQDDKNEVRVGEVLHPMIDEHYIMFIETISNDKSHIQLQFLKPGDKPEMFIEEILDKTTAREFCNIHGLWEGSND